MSDNIYSLNSYHLMLFMSMSFKTIIGINNTNILNTEIIVTIIRAFKPISSESNRISQNEYLPPNN